MKVSSVVEGHGEVNAVPILVRRIAEQVAPLPLRVNRPIRISRPNLLQKGGLEGALQLAVLQASPKGGVLVILDADDDCPATMGPELLKRAKAAVSHIPLGLVLAKCEFEAWFLAAGESLAGRRGLPDALSSPANPESIRGAKEWLSKQMPRGQIYAPAVDQAALAATMDLALAKKRSDLFAKCMREIESLLRILSAEGCRDP